MTILIAALQVSFSNCSESQLFKAGDSQSSFSSQDTRLHADQDHFKSVESSPQAVEVSPYSSQGKKWAKGRILVQPRAGVDDAALTKVLAVHGGKSVDKISAINVHIVKLPDQANEKAVAALLTHHPALKYAEVDELVPVNLIPDDPYYTSAWHLPLIGTPAAWDYSQGTGITIAILDTGVDGTHPDLASQMVPGWNFYDNNSNTADVYGHGTKVAGTAAAAFNNTQGVASVSGKSLIMPLRIADSTGYAFFSTGAQAVTYAADHGARVANISFSGFAGSPTVISAAQYMKDKGGLVTVAAGNNGVDEGYTPTTSLIAVSATDSSDTKAGWSSYGNFVSVSAPGVGIYTTVAGGGYGAVSGTSFAAPVTAGVVALMMSAKPTLSSTQIQNLLYSTAVDLGAAGRDPYYGYGRVDAGAAVLAAVNASGVADTQSPLISISAPSGGSVVRGLVPVDVNASDNVGVTRVELYVGGVLLATDSAAPYSFSWDSTTRADGNVTLVAKAYDSAGNAGTSNSVTVTVNNIVDTQSPVVRIASPTSGAYVRNSVTISATATDNVGVTSMVLSIDGVQKASSNSGSISFSWNTKKVPAGTHTIRVDAKDIAGNVGTTSIQVSH